VTLSASILADSAPAIAAATVLENLIDGAIFSVGQAQVAGPDEILPTPDARIVAVRAEGDPPTLVALALTPGIVGRIATPGEELVDTAAPVLAAAVSALEQAGADAFGPAGAGAPMELAADFLAGDDGSELVVVGFLEGDGRVATLVIRRGPDPAPEPEPVPEAVTSHEFAPLGAAPAPGTYSPVMGHALELLNDVEMGVTAELGRRRMTVRDLLALTPGSVIELDRAAGSPVDVLVNGTVIARGEVVVIDEEFGIRISEIVVDTAEGKRA
jgi:flagellar motor switch protein FliN